MSRARPWLIAAGIAIAIVIAVVLAILRPWETHDAAPTPRSAPTATASSRATPPSEAELTADAQSALDARLTECAKSTAATPPERCGIRLPWGTEFSAVDSIRFRIETLPVITLDEQGSQFTATGGVLVATVTGTGIEGTPRTETYRTDDWTVRGDVTASDPVDVAIW